MCWDGGSSRGTVRSAEGLRQQCLAQWAQTESLVAPQMLLLVLLLFLLTKDGAAKFLSRRGFAAIPNVFRAIHDLMWMLLCPLVLLLLAGAAAGAAAAAAAACWCLLVLLLLLLAGATGAAAAAAAGATGTAAVIRSAGRASAICGAPSLWCAPIPRSLPRLRQELTHPAECSP